MIWRNIASTFLTVAVVILIAAAVIVAWAKHQFDGPGPSEVAQCVQVRQGASLDAVSKQLREQGAVSSSYIFRAGADYADKAHALKFGSYLVRPHASMAEILDVITAGGPSTCGTEITFRVGVRANSVVLRDIDPLTGQYAKQAEYDPAAESAPEAFVQAERLADVRLRLTVAEGATSWQIVEALRQIPMLEGEVDGVPAEGSLAPETYAIQKGADRQAMIARMASRQVEILDAAWQARAPDLPYKDAQEALIMASIIEKETGVPSERAEVASVFVNRLRQGMRLETDPTVIYGITKGREVMERGLRKSELAAQTPYNTYRVDGLPPTPIANPGRIAIEAALNPATTDYLFFVADGTGGHAFSTTLAEHNANVARWREIEKQRGPGAVEGAGQGTGVSGG